MDEWIRDRLSKCLKFDIPNDMIRYITNMKTPAEFDEYFSTLLSEDCAEHSQFLTDCKLRLFNKQATRKAQNTNQLSLPVQHNDNNNSKSNSKNIKGSTNNESNKNNKTEPTSTENQRQNHQGAKKKTKFMKLYSNDGGLNSDSILLKGRRVCNCQASEHKLINNCLSCGRIVCEQEGSGPCLYCGEIVCSNEDMQMLKSNTKTSEKLMNSLKDIGGGKSLQKAIEQRDRLLEYERNSEKRTTVIDDELDYFEENSVWLSDEQRKEFDELSERLHKMMHTNRAKRKITVDFAGREIPENQANDEFYKKLEEQLDKATKHGNTENNWALTGKKVNTETCSSDPSIDGQRPIYTATKDDKRKSCEVNIIDGLERTYNRVQDKELLEMQDMRQCLSMHQPWASLLVAGIKKHEGRVWYTEHRGRLWIASTTKDPRSEEIEELEDFYRQYYNDSTIEFPENYPIGSLLGCVNIDDCLSQEEYREKYPNGESNSPYVFICSKPEKLPYIFPIKGQHKIYQIDPKIHNSVCKTLMRYNSKRA